MTTVLFRSARARPALLSERGEASESVVGSLFKLLYLVWKGMRMVKRFRARPDAGREVV